MDRLALVRLAHRLSRIAPIVGRILAAAFLVAATATALAWIGDYPTASARSLVAGLFAVFALVSLAIGLSARPLLRWLLKRL